MAAAAAAKTALSDDTSLEEMLELRQLVTAAETRAEAAATQVEEVQRLLEGAAARAAAAAARAERSEADVLLLATSLKEEEVCNVCNVCNVAQGGGGDVQS